MEDDKKAKNNKYVNKIIRPQNDDNNDSEPVSQPEQASPQPQQESKPAVKTEQPEKQEIKPNPPAEPPAQPHPAPKPSEAGPDDELERLKKENERLKEMQRLRDENEKLGAGPTAGAKGAKKSFLMKKNKFLKINNIFFIVIIAIIIVAAYFVFINHFITSSGIRFPVPYSATSSADFYPGPIGQQMAPSFVSTLSSLGPQLATVGSEEVSGKLQLVPAETAQTSSSHQPNPAFSALSFDNNYALIPIPPNETIPKLTSDGKPTVVYIGGQGCPFCAQERYVLFIALSRFGNFSKVFYDRSALNDVGGLPDFTFPTFSFNYSSAVAKDAFSLAPITSGGQTVAPGGDQSPTPFFYGAYYNSSYINFVSFDEAGSAFLVNLSGIDALNPTVYNDIIKPSGILNGSTDGFNILDFQFGGVPFFDINNQYLFDGATNNANLAFSNSSLMQTTHSEVLTMLQNPDPGTWGQSILGAANILTAQICLTINNTAPVCSLSYISGLEKLVN